MAQNKIMITVDKEFLISTLLFLRDKVEDCYQGETDRVVDSLIKQIEDGLVASDTVAEGIED